MRREAVYILRNSPLLCSSSYLDSQISVLSNEVWYLKSSGALALLTGEADSTSVTFCGWRVAVAEMKVSSNRSRLNATEQIRLKSHSSKQVFTLACWKEGYYGLNYISNNSLYATLIPRVQKHQDKMNVVIRKMVLLAIAFPHWTYILQHYPRDTQTRAGRSGFSSDYND